ncbi:MAG: GNAT family N-acetyltransferase [Pyrinomonadaceae bacterium]|nr:GNAT family N-acetyltransferase [Pyrinomonadaceae bacterium]
MTVFTDLAFARRLESHEGYGIATSVATLRRLQPHVGGTVERIAGAYAIYAEHDPPISRTIGLGMNGAVTAVDVEQVEEFYRSRHMPSQIDLCPLADASLKELLNERGYRLHEFNNVWFQTLADYQAPEALAARVSVREADATDADAWIHAVSRGYAEHDDELMAAELKIATVFFHDPGTRCFLSLIDGEPAGGGAVFIHEGLAALFSGSTIPAARGRGAQTALLHARLRAACEAGCDLALIKTAPGNASQRNVQRAGFRLAYTKVTMRRVWA